MYEFTLRSQRDGESFIDMQAAHGIAYQSASHFGRLRRAGGIRGLLLRNCGVAEKPAQEAAQKPHAPGNNHQPEQESCNASKKVRHEVFGRRPVTE
jgi:hypothetical protein